MDHFLLILTFYKTGLTLEMLADNFHIKFTNLRSMIKRSRNILNEMLRSKWNEEMPRFNSPKATLFPEYALIIDSTSSEIVTPKLRFDEAKIYFDGKFRKIEGKSF